MVAEYIDIIQVYHFAIENLCSGGAALSADTKHPLHHELLTAIRVCFPVQNIPLTIRPLHSNSIE